MRLLTIIVAIMPYGYIWPSLYFEYLCFYLSIIFLDSAKNLQNFENFLVVFILHYMYMGVHNAIIDYSANITSPVIFIFYRTPYQS